jgi:hypothetical protein
MLCWSYSISGLFREYGQQEITICFSRIMQYCLYRWDISVRGGLFNESFCKDISFITASRAEMLANDFDTLF